MATDQLQYPNMEGGFSDRGDTHVSIANGWDEWNTPHIPYWPGTIKRAESKQSTDIFRTAGSAQGMAHVDTLWRGGIFQQLNVTPGKYYEFSIWGRAAVGPGGRIHVRALMNQWGAGPWHYATIYGKEIESHQYGQWVQLKIGGTAWGGTMTVGTEGLVEIMAYSVAWWDAAQFRQVELGDTQPPPDPDPPDPPPAGECGFVDRWQEVIDNQAEILNELRRVPKKGYKVTL